ncbi:MAG TPA: UMP kinase [Spirochaetota bacterium]|jgi:uridylate kinase|nr:UMP kinase [Spirochaetota bacterium]
MEEESQLKYKRILLKLSGEALAGQNKVGINPEIVSHIAREVKKAYTMGVDIALVIGGGNIFRGSMGTSIGIERATGDYMGMLGTIINALAVQSVLENMQIPTRVMTAIEMRQVAEPYIRRRALRHLEKRRIVIFAAGTGNPFFTTDTAAALRAIEIGADLLCKATKVDGVYDKDPVKFPEANKMNTVSYMDVIKQQLGVMDYTAVSLCMENKLPLVVFNLFDEGSLSRILSGEPVGTKIL